VTHLEIRAMLRRVDARQLREEAGISVRTVLRALGITPQQLSMWERGKQYPSGEGGLRWVKFTAALERRAEVTAEIAAMRDEAA
jgi:transcriptional regulator with XRE-family HTH domain